MEEDIGSVLKAAREQQAISLAQMAKRISIDAGTLQKLEENRFHEIAAPVFVRGYLKLYAEQLALPPAQVEAILAHSFGQNPELHLSEANIESQRKSYRRSHAASWFLVALLLAAMVTIALQILNRESWLMRQIRATFPTQEAPADFNPLATGTGIRLQPEAEAPPSPPPIQLESLPASTPALAPAALPAEGEPSSPVAPSLALESLGEDEDSAPTEALPLEETPAVVPMQLRLQGETWLQITDARKKRIAAGTFKAGRHFDLDPAAAPYQLSIGRPNAVSLWIEGQQVDLKNYAVPNTKARYTVKP